MDAEPPTFAIQRERVQSYFYWSQFLVLCLLGALTLGLGTLVAAIYALTFGRWLARWQAEKLEYWIEGRTLRVNQGVFFLTRKAIPLDRVTDIVLAQGPFLRLFNLWQLKVQTAGTGGQVPEAILHGVVNPDQMRDEILATRDRATRALA